MPTSNPSCQWGFIACDCEGDAARHRGTSLTALDPLPEVPCRRCAGDWGERHTCPPEAQAPEDLWAVVDSDGLIVNFHDTEPEQHSVDDGETAVRYVRVR
jgi:hypothetical protein